MKLLLLPPSVWFFCLKFYLLRLIFFFGFLAPFLFYFIELDFQIQQKMMNLKMVETSSLKPPVLNAEE